MSKYFSTYERWKGRVRATALSMRYPRISKHALVIKAHLFGRDKISVGAHALLYHCRVRVSSHSKYISIGDYTKVECNAFLNAHKGYINIGSRCFIGPNVVIQGLGGVDIEDGVMIAGNTFIASSNHVFENVPLDEFILHEEPKPVVIRRKTWIGSNVTIVAGVEIGEYCIIGAGSVVTRDIPRGSVAVGSPARVVKAINLNEAT